MTFFLKFFLLSFFWQIQQITGENELDNAIDGLKTALNKEAYKIAYLKRDKTDRVEMNQTLTNLEERIDKLNNTLESMENRLEKIENSLTHADEQFDPNNPLKNNQWNPKDCSPSVNISGNGLIAEQFEGNLEDNCVRALLPVPKFNMTDVIYFEVKILNSWAQSFINIGIGFCDHQFPLEDKLLGLEKNSIGIWGKGEIDIDGTGNFIGYSNPNFVKDDIIGLGIIHQPNSSMQCFATCNGKLLGKVDLPNKFFEMELFPAAGLGTNGDMIRANFGKEKWNFNPYQLI